MSQLISNPAEIVGKGKAIFNTEGEAFIKAIEGLQAVLKTSAPSADIKEKMNVVEGDLEGHPWYKACSKKNTGNKKMLYIHGGAFCLEACDLEWEACARIAEETGAEIWAPQYPLIPKGDWQTALYMGETLYKMMLEETSADDIVFMGDSAGGSIILSLAMYIRELGLPQPKDIILISPSLSFGQLQTEEDKKYLELLEKKDPILGTKCMSTISEKWRNGLPENDYRATPICGDLEGLGHITLFTGTADILNLDSRQLKRKAEENHIDIDYYEKEDAIHGWFLMQPDSGTEEYTIIQNLINGTSK